MVYGFADHKSSNLYKNLPVQTKMAILSRRLILLAILAFEHPAAGLSVVFELLLGLIPFAS